MCTGAELLIAGSIASAGVSTVSALSQASQQEATAQYQRDQATADAQTAAISANLQARQIRTATDRQRADARAALASSGVTVGAGTAEQIDQTVNARGEQDALSAIYGGTVKSQQITTAGNLNALQSENAATASRINATTSALNGFAAVGKGWNLKSKGV